MATQVPASGDFVCVNELEKQLTNLSEQAELKKEEVRNNFQQLQELLKVRETLLLKEMDDIVTLAGQKVTEKRTNLQRLYTTMEGLERDLTQNKFEKVLENNLRELENEIGEEVARTVNVGWMELDWKKEQLEQSIIQICKVVSLKEESVARIDYSAKLCPVWSRDGSGSSEITSPRQMAIDNITHNLFVTDISTNRIQVFNEEGNHLYTISTPPCPIGICVTDEFIFVSTDDRLVLKITKWSIETIKTVETEEEVYGIETNTNTEIYVCENHNQSIVVFDKDLIFLRRIKLNSTQIHNYALTYSIKLYEENMYVMFGNYSSPPPFNLQIFTLEGELVKCLIKQTEIVLSYFFSIDQLGNCIVADWFGNQIKIFSKEGELLHTITSDMLPGDQMFYCPAGVAIDKEKKIIVAHCNNKCNLLAF